MVTPSSSPFSLAAAPGLGLCDELFFAVAWAGVERHDAAAPLVSMATVSSPMPATVISAHAGLK